MELTLVEKLDRIFDRLANFDISGMCNPELVTVELARELQDAYTKPGAWHGLVKAGYDIHAFGGPSGCSGLVGKWVKRGKTSEHLKLYYDQDFPARIAREKEALRDNGSVRQGDAAWAEGAEPAAGDDRG